MQHPLTLRSIVVALAAALVAAVGAVALPGVARAETFCVLRQVLAEEATMRSASLGEGCGRSRITMTRRHPARALLVSVAAALAMLSLWSASAAAMQISEIRVRGPNGANDEFVELYNESSQPVTVSTSDGSAGWAVAASNGVIRFVVPNGTVIPPRAHYLGVNSVGYSLAGHAAGDVSYTTDIADNAGIALFRTANAANFTLENRLDAVGSSTEANTLYKEGTGYPSLTPFPINYSFYRGLLTGSPLDVGSNATDFVFVDTNGTSAGAGQRLGAPGPQNSLSPILGFNTVAVSPLDPSQPVAAPPNLVRSFTSDPANNSTFGTLSIRRSLTNNTGAPITRLGLRVVDLTTFPSPSGVSDLRPRTSTDTVVGAVTVRGTTLEQPPSQPHGGGFNSSLRVGSVSPATPLPPGGTVAVQILLGIQQTGSYRFCAGIEGLPAAGGTISDAGATNGGTPGAAQCAAAPAPPPSDSPAPAGPEPPAPPGRAPAGPQPDRTPPVVSGLALSRSVFSVDPRGRASANGTTLRFRLSEAARTAITVSRLSRGRRISGRCRRPTRRNRSRPGCLRATKLRTFTVAGRTGRNSVPFSGKIRSRGRVRLLKPGRYRLTVRARDAAGNRGKSQALRFRVVR